MWSLGGAPDARGAEADVYKTNIPGTRVGQPAPYNPRKRSSKGGLLSFNA